MNSGATPALGTGPSVDHTLGTALGRYIYVKSIGIDVFETARIKSYVFEPVTQNFCLEFWYHMLGRNIHSLNINQYMENSQTEYLIWSLSDDQGDKWNRATIPLSSDEKFSIIIEAYASADDLR